MLNTVVDDLVDLEKQVSLVSKELSGYIFVFVSVEIIAICHCCQNGFDEVLEALVDQMLLFSFEFGAPLLFAEVLLEVLLDFTADKSLCFENALVYAVKEDEEHPSV